jgi:hypothetical protein
MPQSKGVLCSNNERQRVWYVESSSLNRMIRPESKVVSQMGAKNGIRVVRDGFDQCLTQQPSSGGTFWRIRLGP